MVNLNGMIRREDIVVKELPDGGGFLVGLPEKLWEAADRDRRYLGFPDMSSYLCFLMLWHLAQELSGSVKLEGKEGKS